MGQKSLIEWTDHTFNPWWGCTAVSPACDHCYAETFAKRVGFSSIGSQFAIWGKDTQRRFFGEAHWNEPLKWNQSAIKAGKRRRVFSGSMCDVMEEHPHLEEARQRLFQLIERTPFLEWMLLTKRPQNFRRYLPAQWLRQPLPHVRLMTTVESSDYLWRAEALVGTPSAKYGLSIEPLLGPLDLTRHHPKNSSHANARIDFFRGAVYSADKQIASCPRIDWIIVGAESGAHARATDPSWLRSLIAQCRETNAGCFIKQQTKKGRKIPFEQWPLDLQVRQFPDGIETPHCTENETDSSAACAPCLATNRT